MKNTDRNIYIDVMKGLLIILVVIGHLPFFDYDSRTLTLIYSFHMPAFLIIGGMLSHIDENTTFRSIIFKRIKGTLVPYFIFYLISFLIVRVNSKEKFIAAIKVVFRGIGDPINAINLPLWFLTFYFVAMVIFELIEYISYKVRKHFFKKKSYFYILILDLIIIIPIMYFSYKYSRIYKLKRLPFNVEIAAFCQLFIVFGKVCKEYIVNAYYKIKELKFIKYIIFYISIFIMIALTLVWYKSSMSNGRIDLNARDYKNAFYMYVNAILGFIIFAYFSYFISKIPFVNYILSNIGKYSIYILSYHVPSTIYTYGYIISNLPAIVGTTLSKNSLYSIITLSSFGILFSLIIAFFHETANLIYKNSKDNSNSKI